MRNECMEMAVLPKGKYQGLLPISHGEEKCVPNHFWGAGVRENYLIHYVLSGKGVFYCGTEKHVVTGGQAFVIFPGTVVKYVADGTDPWHYTWVSFRGDEVKEIFRTAGITLAHPVAVPKKPDTVLSLLRDMPAERSADVESNLRFAARLYEFLSLLIPSGQEVNGGENAYFTTASRYIKAHYAEQITVDQVAAHVGISRKYLFAIFKRQLGLSPKEYVTGYRIERAKEFLRDRALSVGNIAYSVGYTDPLNFSKIFKQKTGLSPSEYRETVK